MVCYLSLDIYIFVKIESQLKFYREKINNLKEEDLGKLDKLKIRLGIKIIKRRYQKIHNLLENMVANKNFRKKLKYIILR